MANKWQIMVLGVVIMQGIGAMEPCSVIVSLKSSFERKLSFELKSSLERKLSFERKSEDIGKNKIEPKSSSFGRGHRSTSDPELEEVLKKNPRLRYVPFPI